MSNDLRTCTFTAILFLQSLNYNVKYKSVYYYTVCVVNNCYEGTYNYYVITYYIVYYIAVKMIATISGCRRGKKTDFVFGMECNSNSEYYRSTQNKYDDNCKKNVFRMAETTQPPPYRVS